MTTSTIGFLNFARWMAAFLVVISHIKTIILVDFKDVTEPQLFTKFLYLITGVGHEAVIIFFVISGFLVGGITFKKWQRNGPSTADYFISRFSRIYTVLIPALIVGGLLDWVGLTWFNHSQLYTNTSSFGIGSLSTVINEALTANIFISNLAMLQTITAPSFGSNGPLWSLA